MMVVLRTRLGRLLRGVADAPTTLATRGTNVNVTLVIVFCISAFAAGIAGGLFGALTGSINGNGFGPFQSLTWLAVLAISGRTRIASSFFAGFLLAVAPTYFTDPAVADLFTVLFGVSALGYAMLSAYDLRASAWWHRMSASADARGEGGPAGARVLAPELTS
jgi:ABC-type branched-subunit amino acid transport system permease subunit